MLASPNGSLFGSSNAGGGADTSGLSDIDGDISDADGQFPRKHHQVESLAVSFVGPFTKVVSCRIDGVNVSISGNQVDSLAALAVLEEVDRLVGKDHLLKRTIVLLKVLFLLLTNCEVQLLITGSCYSRGQLNVASWTRATLTSMIHHVALQLADGLVTYTNVCCLVLLCMLSHCPYSTLFTANCARHSKRFSRFCVVLRILTGTRAHFPSLGHCPSRNCLQTQEVPFHLQY